MKNKVKAVLIAIDEDFNVFTEFYPTVKSAQKEMKKRFNRCFGLIIDQDEENREEKIQEIIDDGNARITEYDAFVGNAETADILPIFTFKIIEIPDTLEEE